jgi:hypothetical protein
MAATTPTTLLRNGRRASDDPIPTGNAAMSRKYTAAGFDASIATMYA